MEKPKHNLEVGSYYVYTDPEINVDAIFLREPSLLVLIGEGNFGVFLTFEKDIVTRKRGNEYDITWNKLKQGAWNCDSEKVHFFKRVDLIERNEERVKELYGLIETNLALEELEK